jgi:hypothetical protein
MKVHETRALELVATDPGEAWLLIRAHGLFIGLGGA